MFRVLVPLAIRLGEAGLGLSVGHLCAWALGAPGVIPGLDASHGLARLGPLLWGAPPQKVKDPR